MRRQQLKTRISALLMAVSLSVVGSFAGVKTIPAAEEMSTTDISLYQEGEPDAGEKSKCRLSLVHSWKLRQQ